MFYHVTIYTKHIILNKTPTVEIVHFTFLGHFFASMFSGVKTHAIRCCRVSVGTSKIGLLGLRISSLGLSIGTIHISIVNIQYPLYLLGLSKSEFIGKIDENWVSKSIVYWHTSCSLEDDNSIGNCTNFPQTQHFLEVKNKKLPNAVRHAIVDDAKATSGRNLRGFRHGICLKIGYTPNEIAI